MRALESRDESLLLKPGLPPAETKHAKGGKGGNQEGTIAELYEQDRAEFDRRRPRAMSMSGDMSYLFVVRTSAWYSLCSWILLGSPSAISSQESPPFPFRFITYLSNSSASFRSSPPLSRANFANARSHPLGGARREEEDSARRVARTVEYDTFRASATSWRPTLFAISRSVNSTKVILAL